MLKWIKGPDGNWYVRPDEVKQKKRKSVSKDPSAKKTYESVKRNKGVKSDDA